ncbi:unnamed protein product [Caenorhabditis bovis]|uniref:Uncharacterized protein n=1 Tax=Caenorhabditis bovis TaxID=2654633 RepID=A0A8S1EHN5_9PELO|nr:unnamed protein product [Caenorhabditis bovis]
MNLVKALLNKLYRKTYKKKRDFPFKIHTDRQMRSYRIPLFVILINAIVFAQEHEIPQFKRGPITIVDETALSNPNSFDYDFSEDLNKPADEQDLYDQFIDQLPMFHLFKLGRDNGVTEVPIVTRKWDTWFTPTTISHKEQKFTFYMTTPKPKPRPSINRGPVWRMGTVSFSRTTTRRPTTPLKWTRRQFKVQTAPRIPPTTTTTTTTQKPSTIKSASRWIAGPRHPPKFNENQNWRHPIKHLQERLQHPIPTDPISKKLPKPIVIQNPHGSQYRGPTYNCRVLNPFTDGQPSSEHDNRCKMLYPGLSLDGSCRCFYKVAGRDEHGCATGFVYACRSIGLRSVNV